MTVSHTELQLEIRVRGLGKQAPLPASLNQDIIHDHQISTKSGNYKCRVVVQQNRSITFSWRSIQCLEGSEYVLCDQVSMVI